MTFIVAEIGVNWEGDFKLLENLLKGVKEIDCNAVKFQAYNMEMIKTHPLKKRLIKSAITESNVNQIDSLAKSVGIEWFCTPMYPEAIAFLEPFVNKYKIREVDGRILLKNQTSPLIERILETKKEIFLSSNSNPRKSKFCNVNRIKWLYCVPKYPCSLEEINFEKIRDFDGYSNHCNNIIAPLTASILGSNILEIHITADKKGDFIDNPVSFDLKELGELIKFVKLSNKIKK